MPAARFTLITPECVRIEFSPTGGFEDAPSLFAAGRKLYGQHSSLTPTPVVVPDEPGHQPFTISTERFELTFTPRGEGLTSRTLSARIRGPFAPGSSEHVTWTPDSRQNRNLGGTLTTLDGLRGPVPLPDGLLSRDGWYLIDDSRSHLLIDGWVRSREHQHGKTDWYLFAYGRDYRAALAALTTVSGPVPMPRRYLLGSWYSRYWPHNSAEYRQIVRDYAAHGFPLDVMVLDMDWHRDGWTGWSWNRDLLPDAEELLRWFREQGLAVTLNLHPAEGIGPHEDRYAAFMHAIGRNPGTLETAPFDAGDRPYMQALFDQVLTPLEESGVDFWWVDWQQDKFVRSIPDLTNLQWQNQLFLEHTTKTGRRGVSFSRWAGDAAERRWGDQRYPIHFSGDAHTGWDMLAFQVPFTAAAGNVGCFFWSHDIGGHFGPRIEEATARWVQFGALSAALRLHSARTGVLDRRPWTCAEPFAESMRCAFALRAELMPYLYSQVRESCERSVPLLRPMYIDHPADPRAYTCPRQYLLGDYLIVAPVVAPGFGPQRVGTQAVWFAPPSQSAGSSPDGHEAWRHWQTGERFAAGDEAIVAADINEVPLFVQEGVPIALRPVIDPCTGPMTAGLGDHAAIRLWATSADATFVVTLAEDDGITNDPAGAHVARTPIAAAWSRVQNGQIRLTLTIGPTTGSFPNQPERRSWTVQIAGAHSSSPKDGAERFTIELPARSIREPAEITVDLTPTDPEPLSLAHAARRFRDAFGVPVAPDLRRAVIDHAAAADPARGAGGAAAILAIGAGIGLVPCDGHFRIIDTRGWIDDARATVQVIDQVGPKSDLRATHDLMLHRASCSLGAPVPLPAQPLTPPPLGLRATRSLRANLTIDGRPITFTTDAATLLTPVSATAWRALGPFPWDWAKPVADQVFSPELPGGDQARTHIARGQTWHDTGAGAWVTWCPGQPGDKWPVDFRRTLGRDSGLAYAATTITSSRKQQVRLVADSGDKLEAWLNGNKVYSQDGFETQAALAGGADVTLLQGKNTLLVKCASGGGGWGFSLAIEGEREVEAEAELDPHLAPPVG